MEAGASQSCHESGESESSHIYGPWVRRKRNVECGMNMKVNDYAENGILQNPPGLMRP